MRRSAPPSVGTTKRSAESLVDANRRNAIRRPSGEYAGLVVAGRVRRQTYGFSRPDEFHVDVEVVLARTVPRKRNLAAVWRQAGHDFLSLVRSEWRRGELCGSVRLTRRCPEEHHGRRKYHECGSKRYCKPFARPPAARGRGSRHGHSRLRRRSVHGGNEHHISGKSIAVLGHGFDPLRHRRPVAERLAQRGDLEGEIGLLDEGVRPERCHQLLFGDRPTRTPYHQEQQLEGLRRKCDGLVLASDNPPIDVQTIWPEPVHGTHLRGHESF